MFQLMKEWEIIDTGIVEPILGQLDGGSRVKVMKQKHTTSGLLLVHGNKYSFIRLQY
jgi:hypothetical protein